MAKLSTDQIDVVAARMVAAEADIRKASDACEIARENREAAEAARNWKQRTSDERAHDISIVVDLAVKHFCDTPYRGSELAFFAKCIAGTIMDNQPWTAEFIEKTASEFENAADLEEDGVKCRRGDDASERDFQHANRLREQAARIRTSAKIGGAV